MKGIKWFTNKNTAKNKQGLDLKRFLAVYDANKFDKPSVTVDMLVFTLIEESRKKSRKLPEKILKLLMIKRGDHPCIGQWALPGGFVMMDESLEEAALRELKEETNIDDVYIEQLYTWGDVDRDPRTRIISCSFMALVNSSSLDIKAGDDADDAGWFTVSLKTVENQKTETGNKCTLQQIMMLELSNGMEKLSAKIKVTKTQNGKGTRIKREILETNGIAFDHAGIIAYGIDGLRFRAEHTDIVFNLMPEMFTLTELRKAFEIILDTEFSLASFRRKIADMVVETDEYVKDAINRPLKLFKKQIMKGG